MKKYHNDVVKSKETSVGIMAVDVNGRVVGLRCCGEEEEGCIVRRRRRQSKDHR